MRRRRFVIVILSLAALLTTLSGCFRVGADELYSLPQASKEYLKLQEQINTVLSSGAEYSPPTAGPNRQSVQLKDLDGDGTNEAIAFFKTKEDKPLKIYIMRQQDGAYETADVIEGDGTAIERVRYQDMNNDGVMELIVGWRMSAALLHMMIYSIKDYQHSLLSDSDYTELAIKDMNGDGNPDVIIFRLPSSESLGEADMFTLTRSGEINRFTAPLSKGIESIKRITNGTLYDKTPAIFAEGGYNGSFITDVLAWRYGSLVNVSNNSSSGVSEETLRAFETYSADINKDGITEIPAPSLLPSAPDTQYYVINWYSFDKYGNKNDIFTTYHDYSDKWYMTLPDDWKDHMTVRRDDTVSGERTLIFSYISGPDATPEAFLKIYTLSGDNKEDRAGQEDRFKLVDNGDYAAEIVRTDLPITISKEVIIKNFNLLYSEWVTGVI